MLLSEPGAGLQIQPLWRLGFRPFFLAGSAFAVLAIAAWGALLAGWLQWQPVGGSLVWHRHEMPFGFGAAIIAGFLLTAVQNWTNHPGLRGRPLMLLFGVWLAARLAWLLQPPLAVLIPLQLAFLPLLAVVLGVRLHAARQRHNYPLVLVLGLLSLCQAETLYGLAQADDHLQRRGVLAALWLVAALIGIIGGRVIPFFTQRGLGLTQAPRPAPRLDRLGLGAALLVAGLTASGVGLQAQPWLAPLFLLIASLHGLRLWRWYQPGIWRVPLLWSLHLAYAWLAVAALGMAAWHLGWLRQPSLASHALAVGGMGGMILAMLARVSLGHTGRPLQPAPAIAWAFASLHLGAACRVVLAALLPAGLWLAALAWAVAFMLFLRHYAALLCQPRVDGQPG
ncbi:short-chain dehydrogenase [Pseudomonas alcaligenes]|uniref:Short-chain dehydrogenase n=1 Tax=Aquipseudomonas alcaligenes TaxID=43263 RepID=A0ABR7S269_AQUAC|nr:NnrS family protein [Pseudomonas alcaligenes]MBC9250651.1 short-chain dehydrogenase [Pseudomonas alcaligenes]